MSDYFNSHKKNFEVNRILPTDTVPGKVHTISFLTLGCKVNRYETDAVRQAFENRGFRVLTDEDQADVYVINTCTVTAEADRKSRQMIRRARRRNPEAIVVAMGCQVELLKSASEADISVGTKNRLSVVDLVLEKIGLEPFMQMGDYLDGNAFQEFGPVLSQEDTRAYIKIEDGCDSFCSYCIIPFARGRVVSREPEDIIREATELGERGFHEIVLTGIHICSFGKDRGEDVSALSGLLTDLDEIPSVHRIRLGSLEPNSMTEEFIRGLSGLKKLCPHFHISLQSGSDSVLSRMNRKYNTQNYRTVLSQIRRYFSTSSITTDIIVAFPAETLTEHEESLAFCREMDFAAIHVFPFSSRKGTKAFDMNPKISSIAASARRDAFLRLSDELSVSHSKLFVGREVDVLLEKKEDSGFFSGYTSEYFRVYVEPKEEMFPGMEVKVKIQSVKNGELFGAIHS